MTMNRGMIREMKEKAESSIVDNSTSLGRRSYTPWRRTKNRSSIPIKTQEELETKMHFGATSIKVKVIKLRIAMSSEGYTVK
ncbi:hypothetical protein M5689_008646 [Euphorbia peplus]|nr:hypothetical protein M5689_008646 [Euphorbia peplus]